MFTSPLFTFPIAVGIVTLRTGCRMAQNALDEAQDRATRRIGRQSAEAQYGAAQAWLFWARLWLRRAST